jgi:RsiW-degrading membrane proteinase PrsW (M82 family)
VLFHLARARRALAPFVVLLGALVSLACAGCEVHPAGTNDVAMVYQTDGAPPSNLVSLVRERLTAAEIVASVEPRADGVTISVDRDESGTVDALLTWQGGLAVYELAPDAMTTATVGVRALEQTLGAGLSRTRLVRDPPLIDLSDAVDQAVARGRTLEITLSSFAAKNIESQAGALGATPVAFARDRHVLLVAPLKAGPISISMGDDLAAYASARALAKLLSSPPLPVLTRHSAARIPTDWPLVAAGTGIPVVLSVAWLFFVRRFDRAQPEPWWLVLATFFLGCLSVIPAALAEIGWMRASQWLDPSLVTMGGRLASLPIALLVFALVIGLSEEGAKFLGAWSLAYHRKEFDEPIDGIVYGAASALGFAAVENVKYFAMGRMSPALIVIRMFMSVPAHLFFGAIWGFALGRTLVQPRTRVLGYVALAALVHGAFDTFLSYPRLTGLALAVNLGMATLFVLLLRQSLRHGVVTPGTNAVDPNRRAFFAVGSAGGFAVSAIALHVVAALLFVSSAYAAGEQTRVGLFFVLAMSSLVTLLGVSAYFLSATIPLDAVLDDYGVTFAGATRAWSSIRAVNPSPRGLHVLSTEGDLWIGPAGGDRILPIARAITRRISPNPTA